MKLVLASGLLAGLTWTSVPTEAAEETERMLSHDVFFHLKDRSPEARQKLIAGCKKYLADHPGTVWFAAGPLVDEFDRDVNDRDFDVALHVVFRNKAAHNRYQTAEGHVKFIEEYEDLWDSVRVFDSYVDASSHGDVPMERDRSSRDRAPREGRDRDRPQRDRPDGARRPPLPDLAAGFAGMIQGAVVAKFDGGFTFRVARVTREWEHNKARASSSLVGKTVQIDLRRGEANMIRFMKVLKPGEELTLDVGHKSGEALTILELTAEQRARAKSVQLER
jgi:hypothetical protein